MTAEVVCECGKEVASPLSSVPPLDDSETVINIVRSRHHLYQDDQGVWRLSHSAFRREDIEAKKVGKSVSLLREAVTPEDELVQRATLLCQEVELPGGALIAKARTKKLRALSSPNFAKCVCLYADPKSAVEALEMHDEIGASLGHASLKKHCKFSGANDPEAWNNLRSELAEAFDGVTHVLNGEALTIDRTMI